MKLILQYAVEYSRWKPQITGICRINSYGTTTIDEVESAIQAGADEILIPMVRRLYDVEQVLMQVRERCKVGILLETIAATQIAPELARLPLARVYVGLNDLGIERRTPNIFTAIADGRSAFGTEQN